MRRATDESQHIPDYRLGRIKHERVSILRDEKTLLSSAMRLMAFHAKRKAYLEV